MARRRRGRARFGPGYLLVGLVGARQTFLDCSHLNTHTTNNYTRSRLHSLVSAAGVEKKMENTEFSQFVAKATKK